VVWLPRQAAERVAGEIFATKLKPALKKASEQDFVEVRLKGGRRL
jgi:hypothetical protein